MTTLRISERTSLDDVLNWRLLETGQIHIAKSADFEFGAQGVALSSLRSLLNRSAELEVLCDFPEPKTVDDCQRSVFGSAFGFSLARLAKNISFESFGKPASSNFKSLLAAYYRESRGCLGIGTHVSMVSADPSFPVPPILVPRSSLESAIPAPSNFGAVLTSLAKRIGLHGILQSRVESDVLTFIYEGFRNSVEHGIPEDPHMRARSTRGVLIEKLIMRADELEGRDLSSEVKDYLSRISELAKQKSVVVACISVSDQGDGIYATLPRADPNESDPERFARAFNQGESRKPLGVLHRGLGLPNIVGAAARLQSLIRIRSGEQGVSQDFSSYEGKYPALGFGDTGSRLHQIQLGTCVSVFLPLLQQNPDQPDLFKA